VKNWKLILPTIALGAVLGGASVLAVKNVSAYFGGNSDEMAQNLASKLNISQDTVSSAMSQIREEKQAERTAEISANLDKAVSDGVITTEQKQKILDEEAKLKQQREDHQQWIKDSGIDFSKLKSYGIGMMGMGKGKGKGGMDCCGK